MKQTGTLAPLVHTWNQDQPIDYLLQLSGEEITLNNYLGTEITISFTGEIRCIHCDKRIKKTYGNGYCYPCFASLPQTDLCFVRPDRCHFHEGTCRDPEFGLAYCMTPHFVYLAISSGVKVGITRAGNETRRWIDQGAVSAVPIACAPTRKDAGEIEALLSNHLPDKTNWRRMLTSQGSDVDLTIVREEALGYIPELYHPFLLSDEEIRHFHYPQVEIPEKVKSINLLKQSDVTGNLLGVKGQYIILDQGVLQVRNHSGYYVSWEASGI
ncbi:Protein of unknown function [Thermoactinomyces sp. DSM 45891]|uniref:DUF2797 domain-containing protein n=1 Tax=Thermoactinomyces sp. DSM 45891 TaxID=1761907 RepID=UPI000911F194|nr:DUF2797 domain-containing protein [Thermoactinomyces sp. DSM 45891]SFX18594.1 Protein of unknown function [Thermoactinomyces sp. DSM 45891]